MQAKDAMFRVRKEVGQYSHACESLITAALRQGETAFTPDEIEWITYYAKEMSSLVDKLSTESKPQGTHKRPTMREYARASEACLEMKDFSNEEQKSIRHSVADVREKILDADENER